MSVLAHTASAATGAACTTHNAEICASCNTGGCTTAGNVVSLAGEITAKTCASDANDVTFDFFSANPTFTTSSCKAKCEEQGSAGGTNYGTNGPYYMSQYQKPGSGVEACKCYFHMDAFHVTGDADSDGYCRGGGAAADKGLWTWNQVDPLIKLDDTCRDMTSGAVALALDRSGDTCACPAGHHNGAKVPQIITFGEALDNGVLVSAATTVSACAADVIAANAGYTHFAWSGGGVEVGGNAYYVGVPRCEGATDAVSSPWGVYPDINVYSMPTGCEIDSCTCAFGTAVTDGVACTTHNTNICASCNAGYDLSNGACSERVCTCTNGVAATGAACPTHNTPKCASCTAGYALAEKLSDYECVSSGGQDGLGELDITGCAAAVANAGKTVFGFKPDQAGVWRCVWKETTTPNQCGGGASPGNAISTVNNQWHTYTIRDTCSACEIGYNGYPTCVQNQCTACVNGVGATGVACTTNGGSTCGSCNAGYNLDNGVCLLNACTACTNGVDATGITTPICATDGGNTCQSCSAGYTGSTCSSCANGYTADGATCELNQCTACLNGVAATGTACATDGGNTCASCNNAGFRLENGICLQNVCTCAFGTAATLSACTAHNTNICASCTSGYYVSGSTCELKVCTACTNGVDATGTTTPACATNGGNTCQSCSAGYTGSTCSSCTSGYHAVGAACVENVCICTNGVLDTVGTCTTHNAQKCASCDSNYYLEGTSCPAVPTATTSDPPASAAVAVTTNPKDITEECTLSAALRLYYKTQNKMRSCKIPGTKQTRFGGNLLNLKIKARKNNRVQFTEAIDCVTKDKLVLTFCGDTKPTSLDIQCDSPPCIWKLCKSGVCETKTVSVATATISLDNRRRLVKRRLSSHDIDSAETECGSGESWNENTEQCIPDSDCEKVDKIKDGTLTLGDVCPEVQTKAPAAATAATAAAKAKRAAAAAKAKQVQVIILSTNLRYYWLYWLYVVLICEQQ